MMPFLNGVARAVAESFDLPGPILEIGSYQVAGQEEIADLRPLFAGKRYLGVDVRPGPGVDCVADVEDLSQADASVGTVIAMNTFEHVPRFWRGFEEIERVLRPDGVVLVSVPFYFRIHHYPSDYWRFTPQALDTLVGQLPEPHPGLARPPQASGQRLGGGLPRRPAGGNLPGVRPLPHPLAPLWPPAAVLGPGLALSAGPVSVWTPSLRLLPGPRALGNGIPQPAGGP